MQARDVMTKEVKTLNINDSLEGADTLMSLGHLRHIPILNDEGALVGMVSNHDIFRSAFAFALGYGEKGRSGVMKTVLIKEIMTAPVITVTPETPVAEAVRTMVDKKIGGLPVVQDGKLVGMVTETDILRDAAERLY